MGLMCSEHSRSREEQNIASDDRDRGTGRQRVCVCERKRDGGGAVCVYERETEREREEREQDPVVFVLSGRHMALQLQGFHPPGCPPSP